MSARDVGEARVVVPPTVPRGEVTYVRALISHPMHTGLFRDVEGHPIPAYFINDVTVLYGDELVARFEWTSGISRDPYVTFPLRATRDAPLTVTWKDNQGGVFTQTARIVLA